MKRFRIYLLTILTLLPFLGTFAQDVVDDSDGLCLRLDSLLGRYRKYTTTVKQRIGSRRRRRVRYKTVTKTITRDDRIGIAIWDLTADSMIYTHNAEDRYIPASNQKIFVAVAALENLGTNFHFKTDVLVDGDIKCDSTNRDYLDGNIYIHGRFDPTLDINAAQYIARRIETLGIDSINGGVYSWEPLKNRTLSGTWFWNKHPSRTLSQKVVEGLLADSLSMPSGKPYGVVDNFDNAGGNMLMSIATPIEVVLQRMMKRSDNAYAESMLLSLMNQDSLSTWSYEGCRDIVRHTIAEAGGIMDNYVIDAGSGLSHNNRTTPLMLCKVLRYAYRRPEIYTPLYKSLPIAGVDGTLRNRMRGTRAFNNVRGKTGTVNGVSTLSGYLTASNGHILCFSILMNNISGQNTAQSLQNTLCIEMCR